jgi:hypothetical protein
MIDNVRSYRAYRPAIHLWDALAQTTFDNVASNGALIIGPGVPTPENDPVPDLLSAAAANRINTPYAPVHADGGAIAPHQSSPTLRLTGCKLMQIIPGQAAMNDITAWALRKPRGLAAFTLIDASFSVALARNLVGPQHAMVRRMRTLRRAAPVDMTERPDVAIKVTRAALRDAVIRPFRHIDVDDCELIRGPSLLLAETVTVRNSKFPQYGDAGCEVDGWVLKVVRELPIGKGEASFLFYGSANQQADVPRRLRPVVLSLARRTSFDGNLGYPEYGVDHNNPTEALNPWPLLLDFAPRQTSLSAAFDIMQTTHPMIRNKLLFLHADYLGSRPF